MSRRRVIALMMGSRGRPRAGRARRTRWTTLGRRDQRSKPRVLWWLRQSGAFDRPQGGDDARRPGNDGNRRPGRRRHPAPLSPRDVAALVSEAALMVRLHQLGETDPPLSLELARRRKRALPSCPRCTRTGLHRRQVAGRHGALQGGAAGSPPDVEGLSQRPPHPRRPTASPVESTGVKPTSSNPC